MAKGDQPEREVRGRRQRGGRILRQRPAGKRSRLGIAHLRSHKRGQLGQRGRVTRVQTRHIKKRRLLLGTLALNRVDERHIEERRNAGARIDMSETDEIEIVTVGVKGLLPLPGLMERNGAPELRRGLLHLWRHSDNTWGGRSCLPSRRPRGLLCPGALR